MLRPSPSKGRAGTPSTEEPEIQVEPMVDEAADANAIEVNNIFIIVKKTLKINLVYLLTYILCLVLNK